jgi:hypothetical protein
MSDNLHPRILKTDKEAIMHNYQKTFVDNHFVHVIYKPSN